MTMASIPAQQSIFQRLGLHSAAKSERIFRRCFSYGHRNGFGMAFDPIGGFLWETENADDAFSEINRIVAGMNGGWIQHLRPAKPYGAIQTNRDDAVQQRIATGYPPTRLAYSQALAARHVW